MLLSAVISSGTSQMPAITSLTRLRYHHSSLLAAMHMSQLPVHCSKGVSRSASIVIAYIMREMKASERGSSGNGQERRRCICPNAGFVEQLTLWAYFEFDVHLRNELGMVIGLKEFDHKARARWDGFEKRAQKRH